MRRLSQKLFGLLLVTGLLTLATAPARAATTLNVWLTDFACSFTDENGITQGIPCNGSSVTVSMGAGDSFLIRANLNYAYSDDGLKVPEGQSMQAIQLDSSGLRVLPVTYEAGWIYVYGTRCDGRSCRPPPGLDELGTSTFPPIILGLNEVADELTGVVPLSAGYSVSADLPFGFTRTASLSFIALTQSVAAPIPEPATWALMIFGLAFVAGAAAHRPTRAPTTLPPGSTAASRPAG
jgi:hypothetical protein